MTINHKPNRFDRMEPVMLVSVYWSWRRVEYDAHRLLDAKGFGKATRVVEMIERAADRRGIDLGGQKED